MGGHIGRQYACHGCLVRYQSIRDQMVGFEGAVYRERVAQLHPKHGMVC